MPQKPKYELEPLNIAKEPIGKRIARLRKEQGRTQEELGEIIGISRKLVTDYETGRVRLYDEMVIRFAIALKVTTDELLGLKDSKHVEKTSLRVRRRMKEIESLPEYKKKSILKTIDDLIRANT